MLYLAIDQHKNHLTININKHNLSHDAPTENYTTQKFKQWIKTVVLPVVDSFEVNMNVAAWELYEKQNTLKNAILCRFTV